MTKSYVYAERNIENGKMYIGYHKTSDVDDGYVFSSEDEEQRQSAGSHLPHGSNGIGLRAMRRNFLRRRRNQIACDAGLGSLAA